MDIFFEIHKDLPREGPGSIESTRRAFHLLKELPEKPAILDVGCGPGMQTILLARLSQGHVIGLDNHQPYLDRLEMKAREEELSDRIRTVNGSMFEMRFEKEYFDVIWAEGAIYIMGFEKGLKEWRHFLKVGGYMAVTEVSWLRDSPPQELFDFWDKAYPQIKSIDENLSLIEECGYCVISHFTLPEKAWWDDYYYPLEKRVRMLRKKYAGNKKALALLDEEDSEIELYRKYSKWYGYVFYIMQKI